MKKILLISYFFPPDSAVGGLRIARFAKHLPLFEWTPLVLTIEDRYRQRLDKERLRDVENVAIYRTSRLPALKDFYVALKNMLGNSKNKVHTGGMGHSTAPLDRLPDHETAAQKLKRYFISLFVFLPDEEKNWIIPAAIKAVSVIRKQKVDCLLTSGPPHSSHLIGLLAKKATNVKWIADFRDPWVDFLQYRTPLGRSTLSDRIEHWMEGLVVHGADGIMTTTPELRHVMESRYKMEQGKFFTVLNGIDADKFTSQDLPEKYNTFTISYGGSLYEGRTPEPLFAAIQKLLTERKITASQIAVKLFGSCEFIDGKPTVSVVQSYGLERIVEVSGQIPYSEAIRTMHRSHLLLLPVPSIHHLCIPAKLFDYFGTGTRVLALTEQGATAELLKMTGSGECFSPSDITGISDHLYMLMQRENRHLLTIDRTHFAQFDGKLLTQHLAERLKGLVNQSEGGTYCRKADSGF